MSPDPEENGAEMVDVALGRVVYQEGAEQQYIFLAECNGSRGFPIVIGTHEAGEIHRVIVGREPGRPLTHQLCFEAIAALEGSIVGVDIVDLKHNTFFARLRLLTPSGDRHEVDARPSDAIALALRAKCAIRVSERVLELAGSGVQPPEGDEGPSEDE
jgi:bifunctional DNase/RNase